MNQLTLTEARAAGEHGMSVSMARAERADPEFKAKAEEAILRHLRTVGEASGEDLVEIAKAHGATPPDDRSFGGIFISLSSKSRGLIRCVRSDLPRKRGHGTTGGKLWAVCQ